MRCKKIGQDFNASINNVIDSRKIHFVNRIDKDNLGDWLCSPLNYYYEYFSKFNIVRHDIDFIDWHEIKRDDIEIITMIVKLSICHAHLYLHSQIVILK